MAFEPLAKETVGLLVSAVFTFAVTSVTEFPLYRAPLRCFETFASARLLLFDRQDAIERILFSDDLMAGRASGVMKAESISTATERCNNETERTRRCAPLMSVKRPSRPVRGPALIRTRSPTVKNGQG